MGSGKRQYEQHYEIFNIANNVGETIVIPHIRRAAAYWEELINSTTSLIFLV